MPRGKKYSETELGVCADYLEKALEGNARTFEQEDWEAMTRHVHQHLGPILGETNVQLRQWENLRKRILYIGRSEKFAGDTSSPSVQRIRKLIKNFHDDGSDNDSVDGKSHGHDGGGGASSDEETNAGPSNIVANSAGPSIPNNIQQPKSVGTPTTSASRGKKRKAMIDLSKHATDKRVDVGTLCEVLLAQVQQREADRLEQQIQQAERRKEEEARERLRTLENTKQQQQMLERNERYDQLIMMLLGKQNNKEVSDLKAEVASLKREVQALSEHVSEGFDSLKVISQGFHTLTADITKLVRAVSDQSDEGFSGNSKS